MDIIKIKMKVRVLQKEHNTDGRLTRGWNTSFQLYFYTRYTRDELSLHTINWNIWCKIIPKRTCHRRFRIVKYNLEQPTGINEYIELFHVNFDKTELLSLGF